MKASSSCSSRSACSWICLLRICSLHQGLARLLEKILCSGAFLCSSVTLDISRWWKHFTLGCLRCWNISQVYRIGFSFCSCSHSPACPCRPAVPLWDYNPWWFPVFDAPAQTLSHPCAADFSPFLCRTLGGLGCERTPGRAERFVSGPCSGRSTFVCFLFRGSDHSLCDIKTSLHVA